MKRKFAIVAAVALNGVIGINGQLPWHLPDELDYFRKLTMGGWIVMGRRTFEAIGAPLPKRINLVVSSRQAGSFQGGRYVTSLPMAQEIVENKNDSRRVFFIGGYRIILDALPLCSSIFLSIIHATPSGDSFFPLVNWSDWRTVSSNSFPANQKNQYGFTLLHLKRGES